MGIGGALSNPNTVGAYPFLDIPMLQAIFRVMAAAGETVFANLSLLLTIGLCAGLANRDRATAVLAGVVGYLIMNGTIAALLSILNPEGAAIDTGVIGGIVVLIAMFLKAFSNKSRNYSPVPIEMTAIYWHFVDALWIYLFIFLNLIQFLI